MLCGNLFQSLLAVKDAGLGVLLVEQNAKQSLKIADRGYLLENGEVVHEDTAEALARDPAVQKAYLGGSGAKPSVAVAPKAVATPSQPARASAGPSPKDIAAAALSGLGAGLPERLGLRLHSGGCSRPQLPIYRGSASYVSSSSALADSR